MSSRFMSAYEKVLNYRDDLGLAIVTDVNYAIDDLIFSHKWLNHQFTHLMKFVDRLQEQNIIEIIDSGTFDIFELFKSIDKLILHREAMLRVIKNFKLEEEYEKELKELLEE